MSKSLKRVRTALEDVSTIVLETGPATTAQMAADVLGVDLDQIAKSIVFRGEDSGTAILFITAGGNMVDHAKASKLAGEPLGKADAQLIREQTGFAIGGVSPVGHLNPIRAFLDPRLMDFSLVFAAAGTPRHVFSVAPADLERISGASCADFTA